MLTLMTGRAWTMMGFLAAMWGASYLFIEIGLDDLSPAAVVFARTTLGALVLLPFAIRKGALSGLRGRVGALFVLAAVQIAGPFLLISVGQQEISSSLAGILVASAPIFTALIAIRVSPGERSGRLGTAGVAIGILGVAVLLGVDLGGDSGALLGGLMVLLASLGYAIGAHYLKRRLAGYQPVGIVTGAMTASALLVLPLAVIDPGSGLGLGTVGAMAALGFGGTGLAFLIFYTLIADVGASKASVVAYIAPAFAVLYGVTLLGENVTASTLAGLGLILAGSYLAAEGRLPGRAGRTDRSATPAAVAASAAREAA